MKKIALFLAASVAFLAFSPAELSIGDSLPKGDLTITDVSGKKLSLNDARKSNGLLVMFSCNTCPYVVKNQERTKEILKYAKANEVGVVVLNSNEAYREGEDSPGAMKQYAEKQDYNWAYAIDQNHVLADAFGASRTPECYLFNNKNKLVYHGAIDDSPADASSVSKKYLKDAIDAVTAGKEVAVETSRSIGCSIKRLKKGG